MKTVRGHALRYEGRVLSTGGWVKSGPGPGRCECGAISPELPSTAARQRWHRDHKQAVINAEWDQREREARDANGFVVDASTGMVHQ